MDLRSFPMDCQKFRIILRQSGSIPFRFMPEPIVQTEKAAAFTRMDTKYSILDEWDLHSTAVKFGDSRGDDSRSKKTYSEVAVHFRLRRKYSVYFWNFTFYLMIISFLSLTCFVLNHYNSGNRLNLAVTILLTQVAFQYVVADSLPKIPYLTTLSKYIIACFVFVGTVSIESAIYVRFRIRIFDKYFGLFMLVVWAVYHLGFLFYAIYLRVDGCHKLESETDKKLQRDRKQDESHEEKKEENDKKQNDKHTQFLMPWKGLVALKKQKGVDRTKIRQYCEKEMEEFLKNDKLPKEDVENAIFSPSGSDHKPDGGKSVSESHNGTSQSDSKKKHQPKMGFSKDGSILYFASYAMIEQNRRDKAFQKFYKRYKDCWLFNCCKKNMNS